MKILFIGGTGVISSACSALALERGLELFLLNRGDWIPRGSGNTFGSLNSIWASGQTDASNPPRDGGGAESRLLMPPPRGATNNPAGVVQSVAELGAIFPGRFGANLAGVTWLTRLVFI